MVYTVTLNPALDYVMRVDKLRYDDINRSQSEDIYYGGKGINVSVILTRLGVENIALGFVGGFTGDKLIEMLENDGIRCDFNKLDRGSTRINVKIKTDTPLDINAKGPDIDENQVRALLDKLSEIKKGDYLILAGSVPDSLSDNIYERMLAKLKDKGVNFVVDATGDLLKKSLSYKPFLIKPNHHELGDMFGVKTESTEDIVKYAKKLQQLGARNVLVSRSKDGAILIDENSNVTQVDNIEGKVVNSVGCGDSMVGGFVAGFIEQGDYAYALKLGAACGNATAFSEGLAQKSDIDRIFKLYK